MTIAAAVSDARSFRIPNWVWAGLAALFPLYVLSAPREVPWEQHIGVSALVLAIGFALFAGNFAGAGDVKFLAATALWSGPKLIGVLLVVTGLAGGVLALGYVMAGLWARNRTSAEGAASLPGGIMHGLTKVAIPYGIAIAAGSLAAFGMMADPALF